MMNDTFMKEKPVLPLILSMLVNFSIQHYRQPFRRADQRGSYDGIIWFTWFKISSMLSELDLALESTQ